MFQRGALVLAATRISVYLVSISVHLKTWHIFQKKEYMSHQVNRLSSSDNTHFSIDNGVQHTSLSIDKIYVVTCVCCVCVYERERARERARARVCHKEKLRERERERERERGWACVCVFVCVCARASSAKSAPTSNATTLPATREELQDRQHPTLHSIYSRIKKGEGLMSPESVRDKVDGQLQNTQLI